MPSPPTGRSAVADLFLEVADLDPEARAARLAAVSDTALRAEVASLLDADADAASRLVRLDRLVPPPPRALGERIGTVRLVEEIGRGGMGVVYRAHDERLGRDVAVKVLPRALAADAGAQARLEAEARAASALDHPNVCTVHALDATPDGRPALILAFYAGETLQARLARGPLPPNEAAGVLRQMGAGLAAAHRAGIVHRDVKPSNVLLGTDGVVRILDFGIAHGAGMDRTETGAPIGTAAYMAPEQTHGRRATARADVWALGVVLVEMLMGRRPFASRGDALIHAIRHDAPPSLPAGVPAPLRRVVGRALAKDPADRYADAGALLADLDGVAPRWRPRWRSVAAGVAVALAVTAGVWALQGRPFVPDDVFVIAVAPFSALGAGADAEAGVMQALVRRELDGVLEGEPGVRIVEAEAAAPRSTAEAVALGERAGAHLVVWGEAVALRGEVEIRPSLTRAVPFDAIGEAAGGSHPAALLANLSGEDQLALRRTKAAEVGDLALLIAAHYHTGRGDYGRARSLLDRTRQPSAATASLRGLVALLEQDYADAQTHLREAVGRDSTLKAPTFFLGVTLINLGRPVEAERTLRRGLQRRPGDSDLQAMLAWALAAQGRMDESVAVARGALRDAPASQLNRLSLGWAQIMAGEPGDAVGTFEALAARARSRHERAYGLHGIALAELLRGRPGPASVAVGEAVRLVPTGTDYTMLQGQIALMQDDLPLAEQAFATTLTHGPPALYGLDVPILLATVRARLGRPGAADELQAIADTVRGDGYLAPLYRFAVGRATEAEVLAAARRPAWGPDWQAEAHLYLGGLFEAGVGAVAVDTARAVAHYRRAAVRNPTREVHLIARRALDRLEQTR